MLASEIVFIAPKWFTAPPGIPLWDGDQTFGETNCCVGPKRALTSQGRGVVVQDTLPTTAQHDDAGVSKFEKH